MLVQLSASVAVLLLVSAGLAPVASFCVRRWGGGGAAYAWLIAVTLLAIATVLRIIAVRSSNGLDPNAVPVRYLFLGALCLYGASLGGTFIVVARATSRTERNSLTAMLARGAGGGVIGLGVFLVVSVLVDLLGVLR